MLLTESEARSIALAFIKGKYYRGEIALDKAELVSEGGFPVYVLEGSIKILPRGVLGRLISRDPPFTFAMRVHALEGSILDYVVE